MEMANRRVEEKVKKKQSEIQMDTQILDVLAVLQCQSQLGSSVHCLVFSMSGKANTHSPPLD